MDIKQKLKQVIVEDLNLEDMTADEIADDEILFGEGIERIQRQLSVPLCLPPSLKLPPPHEAMVDWMADRPCEKKWLLASLIPFFLLIWNWTCQLFPAPFNLQFQFTIPTIRWPT